MRKALPIAEGVRTWTPSRGHVYQQPTSPSTRLKDADSKDPDTPLPDTQTTGPKTTAPSKAATDAALDRLAEESFAVHLKYGGDYIDENPITGRPGDFHLAKTGRKAVAASAVATDAATLGPLPTRPAPAVGGGGVTAKEDARREGKAEKSPRTGAPPKPKRRKSKAGPVSAS